VDSSSNPAFSDKALKRLRVGTGADVMTVKGSITKTGYALAILIAAAIVGWFILPSVGSSISNWVVVVFFIVTPIVGIITAFKANPILVTLYAVLEGLLIGAFSRLFETAYDGIVLQAVLLTIALMLGMLFLFVNGTVKVTERARSVIMIATVGVLIYMVFELIISLFSPGFASIVMTGPWGMLIAAVIVIIAALNLLLDFDFIERGAHHKLEKKTEWYAAFGLMVTLVWLYVSIIRLLAASRN
jgi:uncharacterized YccA/Bax inhibitor family protein